jgi:predicted O-methyltransferase YrrM
MSDAVLRGSGQYVMSTPGFPWNHIPGHSACIDRIYGQAAQELPDGARIVEVGVMYGRSLAILDAIMRHHGKSFEVFGVDLWEGPPSKEECEKWLSLLGFRERVTLLQCDSVKAAEQFEDGSCDLVFIDGDHSFAGCLRDINAWLPKVKIGGLLAGHDYESTYPGVVAAVHLRFPEYVHHASDTGICWILRRA